MKYLISITNFNPTASSIEFVINSIISINQDNIFLYYNDTRLNNSDYEFIANVSNNHTNCTINPYIPFDKNGYITLFIETENCFSNIIFSYFSFNTITDSNDQLLTILMAHIPQKIINGHYKLITFTPYDIIDSYPPIFTVINSIDPENSTVSIDNNLKDYTIYTLKLMSNVSTPLPNDNYIIKLEFEGDELII